MEQIPVEPSSVERQPQPPVIFGIEHMTSEQVIQLNAALEAQYNAEGEAGDSLLQLFEAEVEALPARNPDKAREIYCTLAYSEEYHDRMLVTHHIADLATVDPGVGISLWRDLVIDEDVDVSYWARHGLEEAIREQKLPPQHVASLMGDFAEWLHAFMAGHTSRQRTLEYLHEERAARKAARQAGSQPPVES